MRKFLSLLLVIIMCASLLLVACDTNKEQGEEKPTNATTEQSTEGTTEKPEDGNDKPATPGDGTEDATQGNDEPVVEKTPEEVIEATFGDISFDGIFDIDQWLDSDAVEMPEMPEFDLDTIINEVKGLEFEAMSDEIGYVGMKDGFLKIEAMGTAQYVKITDDGIVSLTVEEDGNIIVNDVVSFASIKAEIDGAMSDVMGDMGLEGVGSADMSIEDIKTLINQYIPAGAQDKIEAIKLPGIKKEHLELKDGYYIITDAYYEAMAEEVFNAVIGVMGEFGEEAVVLPEEYITQIKTMITGVIDEINLEMGFKVTDGAISGFKASVSVDVNAIMELLGEEELTGENKIVASIIVDGGVEMSASVVAEGTEVLNVTAAVNSINTDKEIGVEFVLEATAAGQKMGANLSAVCVLDNGAMTGFKVDGEIAVPGVAADAAFEMSFAGSQPDVIDAVEIKAGLNIDFEEGDEEDVAVELTTKLDVSSLESGADILEATVKATVEGETFEFSGNIGLGEGGKILGNLGLGEEGEMGVEVDMDSADNFGTIPDGVANFNVAEEAFTELLYGDKQYVLTDKAYDAYFDACWEEDFSEDTYVYEVFAYCDSETGLWLIGTLEAPEDEYSSPSSIVWVQMNEYEGATVVTQEEMDSELSW